MRGVKEFRLWFLGILLAAGVLAGVLRGEAARAAAAKTPQHDNAVFSEFRTRGPLPGGANDEFVEIFNPTNSDVDITNWAIKYSSDCGTTITTLVTIATTPPTNIILAPGQHYLAAASGSSVSGADQTFPPGLADTGGLALVNQANVLVDEVGMCEGTFYAEGTSLAPLSANANRSYERRPGDSLGSCTDTDNNAADFQLRLLAADPQNFSSPYTTGCIGPDQSITFTSAAPANAVVAGATYMPEAKATSGLPVTFSIDASASSVCSISAGVVSFNSTGLCVIDANQAGNLYYNPAPPVQQSFPVGKGNQTISFSSPAPANAKVGGSYTASATASSNLPVTLLIDPAASSVCSISGSLVTFNASGTCTINANQAGDADYNPAPQVQQSVAVSQSATSTPSAPGHLVISEFRTLGPNGEDDEFVEIYNPSGTAVNISGWTIKRSSGCGTTVTTLVTIPANVVLAAGQHYLTAASGSSVTGADQTFTAGMDNDGGVGLLNSSGVVVDQAGMCAATTYVEGAPLPTMAALNGNLDQSYERKPGGATSCYDTSNNLNDFTHISPATPRNKASTAAMCAGVSVSTPSFTPTRTVTRTPTRTPTSIPGFVIINEFLPHPGSDWNGDGTANTGDEYIELINMGSNSINLTNWKLDNGLGGTGTYTLPNLTLIPKQITVFYHSVTGIPLSDGGGTVRLIKSDGFIMDVRDYPAVAAADQTWCHLPDGTGSWAFDCQPSPGTPNIRMASATPTPGFTPAGGESLPPPACQFNLLPESIESAECNSPGMDIWSQGGSGEIWLASRGKYGVFVE